jgi:uncharacterized protein (DUF362 family)
MNSFVDLITVFSNSEDRTIGCLTKVYDDLTYLKKIISALIDRNLPIEKIRGKKILLKPNWVVHSTKASDELCLRTHDNFLLTILEVILEKHPAKITIGDAPIQGCDWDKMLSQSFYHRIKELSQINSVTIEIKDFRRKTFNPDKNNPSGERLPFSEFVIFDTGEESFLEPISIEGKNIFRVTNYNPDRLGESHTKGVHKYCITKEFFDADIIISIPKIKTHQKTGITGALKNLVGVNGDKDFLPHHRIGGIGFGGDCYPGKNYLRLWSELALDQANRNQGKASYRFWTKLCSVLWRLNKRQKTHHLMAAWYGNDTTWRMVMDINKVAIFGKEDGILAKEPQRVLYSLCDGIIGGQGDGPLHPDPLALGVICFSNNSKLTDICMAALMGFDIQKIPLLAKAYQPIEFNETKLRLNDHPIEFNEIIKYSIATIPSPGWIDHLK